MDTKSKQAQIYVDNRRQAKLNGDLTYTGRLCKKHNATRRYTSYGACVLCAKELAAKAKQKTRDIIHLDRRTYKLELILEPNGKAVLYLQTN
jgi:hypothetical protein